MDLLWAALFFAAAAALVYVTFYDPEWSWLQDTSLCDVCGATPTEACIRLVHDDVERMQQ